MMGNAESLDRVPGTEPSLPAERLAGTYRSPTIGKLQVVVTEQGGMALEHGTLAGVLEHWHHDTFRIQWSDPAWRIAGGPGWITFRLDRVGQVESIELVAGPGETERLRRVGDVV